MAQILFNFSFNEEEKSSGEMFYSLCISCNLMSLKLKENGHNAISPKVLDEHRSCLYSPMLWSEFCFQYNFSKYHFVIY